MDIKKLYYTTITHHPFCKNKSWHHGGQAKTVMCNNKDGSGFKMEVEQFGKTKEEAEQKLIKFLSSEGCESECVGNEFT